MKEPPDPQILHPASCIVQAILDDDEEAVWELLSSLDTDQLMTLGNTLTSLAHKCEDAYYRSFVSAQRKRV